MEQKEQMDFQLPDGPLDEPAAIFQQLNGKRPSPPTCNRWARKGIACPNGERIRLRVWYVGRQPRTTLTAVLQFLAQVTAARQQQRKNCKSSEKDVTDEELRSAGLLGE